MKKINKPEMEKLLKIRQEIGTVGNKTLSRRNLEKYEPIADEPLYWMAHAQRAIDKAVELYKSQTNRRN